MNSSVADWCRQHLASPARLLYLRTGPYEVAKCDRDWYDVIITRCSIGDLDNKDFMACLWRLGYEFAAPGCALLLEVEGGQEADPQETYLKMSNIGWCLWDTMPSGAIRVFYHVQKLAPWFTREWVRLMQPNLVVHSEAAEQGVVTPE